ncbi:MAG: lysylphosphatidylglycerol synthase transmembrane domain-containing protein, partial [Bryobacteraceae bacterium]
MKKHHLGAVSGVAVLTAALGYVYFRWRDSGFAWTKFIAALRGVSWNWLLLALVLILATYVGRAMRWEIMLRPLTKGVQLWPLVVATCIGFTAVMLFGRAGEPVRPFLISRRQGVSFSSQIAAWVVERMLDLLMVLVIFGIALTQVSHSGVAHSDTVRTTIKAGGFLAGITGALCLALLIGLRYFHGNIKNRLLDGLSFLPKVV